MRSLSNRYIIKRIEVIDPNHDPRVILDNQRRAVTSQFHWQDHA